MRHVAWCLVLLLVALAAVDASVPTKSRLRVAQVSENELAANSISNVKIQPHAVGTKNIQSQAVTGDKIARDAIDERHFVPGAVTSKAANIETITIILRAETALSNPGGLSFSPSNRILLKPHNHANSSTIEHHHVHPDGFYKAFGRASGPGVILGWYPSLNGHLLRYQADRALRTLSCSNVYTQEHFIRKYDVNIGDYDWDSDSYAYDGGPDTDNFIPRYFMNGARNGQVLQVFADTGSVFNQGDTNVSPARADQGWPGWAHTNDMDDDTYLYLDDDFGVLSTIMSESHTLRAIFEDAIAADVGGAADGIKDQDLRGTRDTQWLVHKYDDLRFHELCGQLGDGVFGPDNVKCRRAQPFHERIFFSNDVRSELPYTTDLIGDAADLVTPPSDSDTNDKNRSDRPGTLAVIANGTYVRDFGFAPATDFVMPQVNLTGVWTRGASANTPPERCSIYTNVGDVRSEQYDERFPDIPGPAEGTPVYSPSLERIAIDETGLVEVRYAGRGMPGASQPDVAITVVVLLNDRVEYEVNGPDPDPLIPDFP